MEFQILSLSAFIVSLAYFFAGFIDSVCGGGGLITIPSLLAIGVPAHLIMGTNQSATVIGSLAGFITYIQNKKIHYFSALLSLPFALIGSYLGSSLNMIFPERYLQVIMIVLIPLIALFLFLKKELGTENHIDELSREQIIISSCLIGFFLGVYQGFYGPGSGMFSMFAYAMFLKLDMLHANGNTKLVVTFSALVAALNYSLSGHIVLKIVILATVFNTIGSRCGAIYAIKKGSKGIRPVMFLVIAGLMIKIITDLF